jgi:UDP-2-acetamido-3-amino-2,3-dideoxy-glucuronate N-acetyltransferase
MKTNDNFFVHPSAHVEQNARVGSDTKIWINVQIRENVEIGNSCIISKDVYIDHSVKIGNRCKIQNSVSIYNGVTIGDDVFVGPNAVFTNDKVPRAFNSDWKITPTTVMNGASIGANATLVCGIEIGEYAMVAAGSVVTKNVPSHALVMGNPAKIVGSVCMCGRRLDDHGFCRTCVKTTELCSLKEIL